MARYRALGLLYLKRLVAAGEEFESDLPPGRNWEPLDEAGRIAFEKYRADNARTLSIVERKDPSPPKPEAIQIPGDWRSMSGPKLRALATRLGAQSNVKVADANSFIEAELERRQQHKAA